MRATLDAFWAGMSVADTTREVTHIISPRATGRIVPPVPASSRALVPISKDSRSGTSKASSCSWPRSSSKSPTALKSKLALVPTSKELIVIEESAKDVLQGKDEIASTTGGVP